MLRFSGNVFDVCRAQRVDLSGVSPSHGYIYTSVLYISTNVVHDDYDISVRDSFCHIS